MALIWDTAIEIEGSGIIARTGDYCRIQITALPIGQGSTSDLEKQYQHIGLISPMVDTDHYLPEVMVFALSIFGPFNENVDNIYYSLFPGVVAELSQGGIMSEAIQPQAVLKRTATQNLVNVTSTKISWQSEVSGYGALWVIGAPTRITITEPGVYLFTWFIPIPDQVYQVTRSSLFKNGTKYRDVVSSMSVSEGGDPKGIGGAVMALAAATDYFEVEAYQDCGSTVTAGATSQVEVVRLSKLPA